MILLMFPFLVVYAIVGILCVRWVKRRWRNPRRTWAAGLAFFPGFLVFDIPFGWVPFKYLCAFEAGEVVFEPVKTEGYTMVNNRDTAYYRAGMSGFCGSDELVGGFERPGFKYKEVEVTHPRRECLADRPGKYRYTLQRRGSLLCALFETLPPVQKDRVLWDAARMKRLNLGNHENYCIGTERIERFQSRYLFIVDDEPYVFRTVGIQYVGRVRVVDLSTGRVTAQKFYPEYGGGWFSRTFFKFENSRDPFRGCTKVRYPRSEDTAYWYKHALTPQ